MASAEEKRQALIDSVLSSGGTLYDYASQATPNFSGKAEEEWLARRSRMTPEVATGADAVPGRLLLNGHGNTLNPYYYALYHRAYVVLFEQYRKMAKTEAAADFFADREASQIVEFEIKLRVKEAEIEELKAMNKMLLRSLERAEETDRVVDRTRGTHPAVL